MLKLVVFDLHILNLIILGSCQISLYVHILLSVYDIYTVYEIFGVYFYFNQKGTFVEELFGIRINCIRMRLNDTWM